MLLAETKENYLESILMISQTKGFVRAIDVVNHLNFSKPSVSVALKQLEESGYITRNEDGHIHLTDSGRQIAESVYERHELLTTIFVSLGVDPDIARDDACRIEHDLSQETFDGIKAYVNKIKNNEA